MKVWIISEYGEKLMSKARTNKIEAFGSESSDFNLFMVSDNAPYLSRSDDSFFIDLRRSTGS
jgi:hypothetical protein